MGVAAYQYKLLNYRRIDITVIKPIPMYYDDIFWGKSPALLNNK